jgi:SOS-response transcriptional repressor LexA
MSTTYGIEAMRVFRVADDSMAPAIPAGAIVGIDPALEHHAGDFVLVDIGGREAVRQLDHDGEGGLCLTPLNERYPAVPLGEARIVGVVREMRVTFR